jgi:uncharacterized membrane protein
MTRNTSWTKLALASAVAGLFVAGAQTAFAAGSAGEAAKVKCEGVNSCKGHGACKSAHNSCAGKNACKGQGFLMMTPEECTAAKAKAAEQK